MVMISISKVQCRITISREWEEAAEWIPWLCLPSCYPEPHALSLAKLSPFGFVQSFSAAHEFVHPGQASHEPPDTQQLPSRKKPN
jgi:hypothetical protein